jgi:tripartite-type tricarboxylate transporter receptor subunit TctC
MRHRKMVKVGFVFIFCLALTLTVVAMEAQGAEFPNKAITVIVPYGVGGTTDMGTRAMAAVAPEYLNAQSLMAVIKPGAGGAVGTAYLKAQPASGYLLINASPGNMTAKPHSAKVGYTYRDFEPIAYIGDDPYVFCVHADSPIKTMQELIEYAKQNPGKLKYSACGRGTMQHLMTEYFQKLVKVKLTYVPYNCFGPATTALLGKHVDLSAPGPASVSTHIKAGKLRPLAVTGGRQREGLDVPTMASIGYPIPFISWKAIFAKKGIPENQKDFLVKAFKKILENKSFLAMMKNLDQPVSYMGPEELGKMVAKEDKLVEQLTKELGISIK